MTRDWDAATYHRVSGPQVEMAGAVLDAGCGSGRVTLMLLERLPRGYVVAVDQAASMVEHAREALPPDRATVLQASLTELVLDLSVDAVFSNAVFHWVPDHDALFDRLFAALRPGGRMVAQCGGEGNVARFHQAAREAAAEEPFARWFEGWQGPWNFAAPAATAGRLARAGFEAVETWLEPYPVVPDDPGDYLRTVCLGYHLERLPEELRDAYAEAVLRRADRELDYVRLNISARRPLNT